MSSCVGMGDSKRLNYHGSLMSNYGIFPRRYIVARMFLGAFSRNVMNDQSSGDIMEELWYVIGGIKDLWRIVRSKEGIGGALKKLNSKSE